MKEEPETKHLSADVLRAQLEKLRESEPATRFDRPWSSTPKGGGADKVARRSSSMADATATSIDADLLANLRKPSLGHPQLASDTHDTHDTHDTLTWSRGPQQHSASLEGRLATRRMPRQLSRLRVLALRGAIGCVVAGSACWIGLAAPPPLSSAFANAQLPQATPAASHSAGPPARRPRDAKPPSSPSPSAPPSPSPLREGTANTRNGPKPEPAGAASARAAVDLLLSGRTRAALDAYRALAAQPQAAPELARVVDLLEREQRACSAQENAACAR